MGTGSPLTTEWLGRLSYENGMRLQTDLAERKAADDSLSDHLFLLEHDPVYTTGRSVPVTEEQSTALPHPILQINRGGKVTYHGPGQLVGYPVLDLRTRGQDLHRHLRLLEEGLVEVAKRVGVHAHTREGLTGVWCAERKLASIGVGVRRWVTMHGFALNVNPDLTAFRSIVPCGITDADVTSLEIELGRTITVDEVAPLVERYIFESLKKVSA